MPRRGKTVTLKGAACRAYVRMQMHEEPENAADEALYVATMVHMLMLQDDPNVALTLVKLAAEKGIAYAARKCIGEEPEPVTEAVEQEADALREEIGIKGLVGNVAVAIRAANLLYDKALPTIRILRERLKEAEQKSLPLLTP